MRTAALTAILSGAPAAVSYSAEATALFARMSVAPDATRKAQIETLILALKAAGVWTKMDALYVNAAHDAQAARLNWIADQYNEVAVNSPTFTTDRGYTGDGTTTHLDTGFNPNTAVSPKFTLNSAHMGTWLGTDVTGAGVDAGSVTARLNGRSAAGTASVNGNNATASSVAVTTSIGWLCWSRGASGSYEGVKNLDVPTAIAVASTSIDTASFYALARNSAGSALARSTRRQQALHFGSVLNDTERDATYNALAAYMTAIGA